MSQEKRIELHIVEQDGKPKAILPEARIRTIPMEDNRPGPAAQSMYDTPATDGKPRPTLGPFPDYETSGYRWAPWGANDCLPTQIRQAIYDVPMAAQAIYRLTQMMYGNGLAYAKNQDIQRAVDDGTLVAPRARISKVEAWLRSNRILTNWLPAQFLDYRMTMNCFTEMILSRDKQAVTNIFHKPAEFCRLSVQNETSMKIDELYFSPQFADGYSPQNDAIKAIRLYDWMAEASFFRRLVGYKFAWHSKFETPGTTYYARPLWMGLFRKNGWIDVSRRVPEVVNAMMNNQIILKYHVLIPESYFEVRYPEWNTYTHEAREKLIDDLIDTINDTLAGTKNAFASITTIFKQDLQGQAMGKIEIIAVDDKLKKDAWVPSSSVADAQIVQGLGLHPSQVGLAPEGGKMGAGSGSDQREAFNTGITVNTIDQQIVLEPLNWIAGFNSQMDPDWDITFYVDHTWHTTTNKQESGMQPSDSTIQIQ